MISRHYLRLSIVLLLTAALAAGCKKSATIPVGVPAKVKMQVSTSATGQPDTLLFTYDSLGRQAIAQADTVVTYYIYTPTQVTKNITLAGRSFMSYYTLGAAGLAVADSRGYAYTYTTDGYLSSMYYAAAGDTDSIAYTISAGDVATIYERQSDAATLSLITTVYTYNTSIDTRDFGMAYLGRINTNLLQAAMITQVINGATYTTSYTYAYSYDAQGRVTRQVETSGTASYTTSYSYY